MQREGRVTGAFISHSDKRLEMTTLQGTSRFVLLTKYYSVYHTNINEIGDGGLVKLWGTREVHTEHWWGHLRERGHLEGLGERREDNTKMNLQGMGLEHGPD